AQLSIWLIFSFSVICATSARARSRYCSSFWLRSFILYVPLSSYFVSLAHNANAKDRECYQTLIVQENRKSVGFCIGAPAADGLINQNIQSLSLRDGIPWSNSLISHISFASS